MAANYVYFDLETQRTAHDVGGWGNKRDMGMSIGAIYSSATGEYEIFSEKRVHDLVNRLMRADWVVGFNVINFDFEVLMGYSILDLAAQVPTVDLLVDIEKALGHRVGLDAVASATIGVGKTGVGLDAIQWWREGRLLDIAEYCCFDVKATKLVHEYGAKHGVVRYEDKFGQLREVAVDWKLT